MANENPILNNPYVEPRLHYATNLDGELDNESVVNGRRLFREAVPTIPVRQRGQRHLMGVNDLPDGTPIERVVNLLRNEVRAWREGGYANATRVSRELLHFWFKNDQRRDTQKLFFAQQEAIETAIFLNEIAGSSNAGQRLLKDLEEAQSNTGNLPRLAFKMATGTGKTVVMGALIVYHFFNRLEYANDPRFADNFLLVAPGITIRDRLGSLRVDSRSAVEAADYYSARFLVPPSWQHQMRQVNAKLEIINYHALQPRMFQGNKRSPFDGKMGRDGRKVEAKEDMSQVIRRILKKFKPDSRLLIINDEAHHCYLPRSDDRTAEGEDAETENQRAAVWFTGLREISQRFKMSNIYDLSATPYYLTGSVPSTLLSGVACTLLPPAMGCMSCGADPSGVSPPSGKRWMMTFDDEFTQDRSIDTKKWNGGAGGTDWCSLKFHGKSGGDYMFREGGDPCGQHYDGCTLSQMNGLEMRSPGSPSAAMQTGGTKLQTSKFIQKFGSWEARFKVPHSTHGEGRGIHSDFWMHPIPEGVGSPSEWLPEINVGERPTWDANAETANNKIYFGIHDYGHDYGGLYGTSPLTDLSADWHTYGLYWRDDNSGPYGSMQFYLDGKPLEKPYTLSSKGTNMANGIYIFLSLDNDRTGGNAANPFLIQYVRVWRLAASSGPNSPSSGS